MVDKGGLEREEGGTAQTFRIEAGPEAAQRMEGRGHISVGGQSIGHVESRGHSNGSRKSTKTREKKIRQRMSG
jgi:hypothetical protein